METLRKLFTEEVKWIVTIGAMVGSIIFFVYNPITALNSKLDLLTYQVNNLEVKSTEVSNNADKIEDLEKDIILLYERCGLVKKTGE